MYPPDYNPDCESVHCDCARLDALEAERELLTPVIAAAIALAKDRTQGFRSMSTLENKLIDAVVAAKLL